jgi:hypothetical protein
MDEMSRNYLLLSQLSVMMVKTINGMMIERLSAIMVNTINGMMIEITLPCFVGYSGFSFFREK